MKNTSILLALAFAILAVPVITKAETPTMCTMQYDPVCGTEKGVYKTYGNSCVLGVEGATYQHGGECTAAELEGKQEGTYTPPANCTAWFDGCNSCSRSANGQAMCTLMACMGEPAAGYCTAYGKTEPKPTSPPPKPVGNESIEPVEAEIVVEATTTVEADSGFFFGIWRAIVAWFQGLF
ncbi:MAG: hypothetical protein Q8S35_01715 [bacterium]|nr:hypothetical protein [bacterium]